MNNFIDTFGTHAIRKVNMGARFVATASFNKEDCWCSFTLNLLLDFHHKEDVSEDVAHNMCANMLANRPHIPKNVTNWLTYNKYREHLEKDPEPVEVVASGVGAGRNPQDV